MAEQIKRVPIFKYKKSGRVAAISSNSRSKGYIVIDMSTDLRNIEKIRFVNYVKRDLIKATGYILEAIENIQKGADDKYQFSYQFMRILTTNDLDEKKWKNTKSLSELPVSTHPQISKEERLWTGEREGNVAAGVVLALWVLISWWLLYNAIKRDDTIIFTALVTLISTYFFVVFKWRVPKKASTERLAELSDYKERLRGDAKSKQDQARTDIEKKLEDYFNWERLSPEEFEHALKIRLENDGYDLNVTKYVGDGGVDLQGVNAAGEPIIIQAKKYRSNVDVAVVREMIGVRESRQEKPLTMIISLVGFTRGATQLAEQQGVILKSIKNDILRV